MRGMKLNEALLGIIRHCQCAGELIVEEERGEFSVTVHGILKGLDVNTYINGQWVHISGSRINDGIYKLGEGYEGAYPLLNGTDDEPVVNGAEAFEGIIRWLRIEPSMITLARDVMEFSAGSGKETGYASESVLGVHSWTKATDNNNMPITWQTAFSGRLRPYTRLFEAVRL